MKGDGIRGKTAWQKNIDYRVQSGRRLGPGFTSDLSTKYGIGLSDIQSYASRNNYNLMTQAAPQTNPVPQNQIFSNAAAAQSWARNWAKENGYSLKPGPGMSIVNQLDYKLGGGKLGSVSDQTFYLYGKSYPGGGNTGGTKPPRSNNSGLNIRGDGIKGDGIKGDGIPGRPGTPIMSGGGDPTPTPTPTPAPSEIASFGPGGPNALLGGNALGFRRKRSSAQASGLSRAGTSQFKISGQTARSSGLNIGV